MLMFMLMLACARLADTSDDATVDFDRDGVAASLDCDDENTAVGVMGTWYEDGDSDGHGGAEVRACERPQGVVDDPGDCNDADANIHPAADESCNGTDDDCDGEVDEEPTNPPIWCPDLDADGQGAIDGRVAACASPGVEYVAYDNDNYMSCPDCDDSDPRVAYSTYQESGAACYDYVDTNCNGGPGDGCEEDCSDGIDNDEDHRVDGDDHFDCDV